MLLPTIKQKPAAVKARHQDYGSAASRKHIIISRNRGPFSLHAGVVAVVAKVAADDEQLTSRSSITCSCCNQKGQFQPRLLTQRLQQAQQVQELQQLWQWHSAQFNSIHFGALMHQLSLLHGAAAAGLARQPPGVIVGAARTAAFKQEQHTLCTDGLSLLEDQQQQQQQQQQQEMQSQGSRSNQQRQVNRPQQWKHHVHEQQVDSNFRLLLSEQQQQQQQATQRDKRQIVQLSCTAAAAALQPGTVEQLDGRALVMTVLTLAKLRVHNQQLLVKLLQAVRPKLQLLDAQQIANLIWAVAVQAAPAQSINSSSRSANSSSASSSSASSNGRSLFTTQQQTSRSHGVPEAWLAEATNALQRQLPSCASPGVTMALWGLAQLGHCPPPNWWSTFFQATQPQLPCYSSQELAVLVYCCGRLRPLVSEAWLHSYLSASCALLPDMSSQELTMSVWGLAAAGLAPHKAWLMAWFLTSRAAMAHSSTQDLSLWLYSLAVMRLTPSPVWCTSFVEASFDKLTSRSTRPQELVNVMWAISGMTWSPPLLYWRGLMDAAQASFSRFNAQDFANCISAVVAVDVRSLDKAWMSAFIQASQPKLSSFEPVQLANIGFALVGVSMAHSWASLCISAAWLAAYVTTAAAHLDCGRFSARNLQLVVDTTRTLHYLPLPADVQSFLQQAETVLDTLQQQHQKQQHQKPQQQQQQQQKQQQQQQQQR